MVEKRKKRLVDGLFVNNVTGEASHVSIVEEETIRKYSIRRVNVLVWIEGYEWILLKLAGSEAAMKVLVEIQNRTNADNIVFINQTKLAKELGYSRQSIAKIIEKMRSIGFLSKIDTGVYMVNPFVLVSKGARAAGNAHIEALQKEWEDMHGVPDLGSAQNTGTLYFK